MATSTDVGRSISRAGSRSSRAKLADAQMPVTLTPSTRRFFLALANTATGDEARAFRDLVSGDSARVRRADSVISGDPLLHALMRTTWAPVLVNGGFRSNVIPGSAVATLNIRTIPGTEPADVVAAMRRLIADSTIDITLPATPMMSIPDSPDTTALYR